MDPQITIIIPSLNSNATIEWTILSLISQVNCRVNIIIADSGSTDGTIETCNKWRIPYIYVPPGNMYRAINEGLKLANTPWLGYLNSDDMVYPSSYSRLISCGEVRKAHIVYGGCDFIDRDNRFIHSYLPGYPEELLFQFRNAQLSFAQPAAIFRDIVFDKLGGFNENYSLASDHDFFIRAAALDFQFYYLRGPTVACFRVSEGQLSQNHSAMIDQVKVIQQGYPKAFPLDIYKTAKWRFRNIPQYLVRILRRYQLSGQFQFARSSDTYEIRENEKIS